MDTPNELPAVHDLTRADADTSTAIIVWRFDDAPEAYRNLSTNGGDEDWLAFVPEALKDDALVYLWFSSGAPFGAPFGRCSCDRYMVQGGIVYIGAHA